MLEQANVIDVVNVERDHLSHHLLNGESDRGRGKWMWQQMFEEANVCGKCWKRKMVDVESGRFGIYGG